MADRHGAYWLIGMAWISRSGWGGIHQKEPGTRAPGGRTIRTMVWVQPQAVADAAPSLPVTRADPDASGRLRTGPRSAETKDVADLEHSVADAGKDGPPARVHQRDTQDWDSEMALHRATEGVGVMCVAVIGKTSGSALHFTFAIGRPPGLLQTLGEPLESRARVPADKSDRLTSHLSAA